MTKESIPVTELRLGVQNGKLLLQWGIDRSYLSFVAINQLARHVVEAGEVERIAESSGPISEWLLKLPATLVAQNLNHRLANYSGRTVAELEFGTSQKGRTLRKITFKIGQGGSNGG